MNIDRIADNIVAMEEEKKAKARKRFFATKAKFRGYRAPSGFIYESKEAYYKFLANAK